MKRKTLGALVLAAAMTIATTAVADDVDALVEKIRAAHAAMKDYEARFTQTVTGAGRAQNASGALSIKLPDKMRWDYSEPVVKQLITDGSTSWMVLPEDNQVYVQPLNSAGSAKTPLLMLTGKMDFRGDYNVKRLEDADGFAVLELTPKAKGTGFKTATIAVDPKSYEIRRFRLEDLYGGVTDVRLTDVRKNVGVKDALFTFTAPEGMEVLQSPGM